MTSIHKLSRSFYERPTLIVARELLGKTLVRLEGEKVYKGKIVETEGYLGLEDKAAHTFHGKVTPRVKSMWGEAGHAYVYFTYGMHYCINVVTEKAGVPHAVLIRAIEPLVGIEEMAHNRFNISYEKLNNYQKKNLTNGPAKLCKALNIDKDLDGIHLLSDTVYIEEGSEPLEIVNTTRIGIENKEEAVQYLYRYYIKGNPHVSKLL